MYNLTKLNHNISIKRSNMQNCISLQLIIHVKFLDGIHSKEVF